MTTTTHNDVSLLTLTLPATIPPEQQQQIESSALGFITEAIRAVESGNAVPDLKLEPGCPAWCDRDHSEGAGYHQHDVLFEPWGRVSVVEEHDAERGVYRIVDAWLDTDVREHELDAQRARKVADALTRAADMLEEIQR